MRVLVTALFLMTVLMVNGQQANAGKDSVIMTETFPVTYLLDASGSTSENPIINYYWVFEEDTIGNSETLEVSLNENKNSYKLIIEDDQNNTSTDFVQLFVGHTTNYGKNRLPLRNGTLNRFVSGMNVAWKNFANDLNSFTQEDSVYYKEMFDNIKDNGGNAVRWWLHTNGANTPMINSSGEVEGIDLQTIQAMKHVLDMAYDEGIVISMCLWSFDMLKNQNQDRNAVKALLTNPENIQSYVDKALIPTLELIGDHPAVMTWEIFNEPEGMTSSYGWTPDRIEMTDVQRFVNMCAGAIHRTTPGALVSNGAWNIQVNTEVDGFKNYYSKENLVAIGGDADGYLDFYQVHYYPNHFGEDKSPFHRPASYWGLDGPIVIGEFPADTVAGRVNPGFSVAKAYELAVNYGYAGILSWSWSSTSDFNRDFQTTARGLKKVAEMLPNELDIPTDQALDRIPQLVRNIAPYRALVEDLGNEVNYLNLANHIRDEEDGSNLNYTFHNLSGNEIVAPEIVNGSEVKLDLSNAAPGITRINYRGADSQGWYAQVQSLVMFGTLEGNESNLTYFKEINGNTESLNNFSIYANDGSLNTFWESADVQQDAITIDLGASQDQNFVAINCSALSITGYAFEGSNDGVNWETIFNQDHGISSEIVFASSSDFNARYVRLSLENDQQVVSFKVNEIRTEHIADNQAPTLQFEVEDYTVALSELENVSGYVRFLDLFDDLEHKQYLTYDINNTDDLVVTPEFSTSGTGLNLIFGTALAGTSTVSVTATDPFGASVTSSFQVTVIDDILSTTTDETGIVIYPNPVSERLFVDLNQVRASVEEIRIYNESGQLIESIVPQSYHPAIEVAHYHPGRYVVLMQAGNETYTHRFIKRD